MNKYKLQNIERKTTSTGKAMLKCSALGEDQVMHEGVAIWSDFPRFADLKDGDEVEAEMDIKQNGQFTNKSLKYPSPAKTNGRGSYGINKAMEKKEESISKFQTNKEESIKISSTIRMAVDVVTAMDIKEQNAETTKQMIEDWRRWFWKHWSDPEDPQYSEPF